MSSAVAENENRRRPKSKSNPISVSDPKPKKTHPIFQFSSKNGSVKSNKSFTKKPKKKINKLFSSVTLGGLGCGGTSSQVSVPEVIRSAAEWEARKQKMKKKKKNQRKIASNVCCTPPGIGFAYDVVPIVRVDAQRRNHRERSCGAPTRNVDLEHLSALTSPVVTLDTSDGVSDARQFRRFTRTLLPEIMILQRNLLLEGSLNRNDEFGDWRLNVDTMSFEELLDLGDRIGYVGTGLQQDEIMRSLVKTNYSNSESFPLLVFRDKDFKCSICQGECKEDEELGRLKCGHYHHINCIKQWLLHKNACPICKTTAVVDDKQDFPQ